MFTKARLTLTGWYLLIIMMVSICFSAVIYRVLSSEVERFAVVQRTRIERRIQDQLIFPDLPPVNLHQQIAVLDPDLVRETKQRILLILIFINSGIILIAGGLGYILSGKTLKPIAAMIQEQHRFVSDASHELRTPLTALKTNLEVNLRNEDITLPEAKQTLVESLEDAKHLEQLSNKLLTLSQFESSIHTNFSLIRLSDVLPYAIRAVTPLAEKKHITFHKKIALVSFQGNMHDLQDLFITILDNAIKYSPEKSRIDVQAISTQKDIVIRIIDYGIGIAKKDLPNIFDRFYRADSARSKTSSEGYGLGLAIAKRVCEAHHGAIHVESAINKGSTFTITLPKKQLA